MIRSLVVVVALSGCVEQKPAARWPEHRQTHDTALKELKATVDEQKVQLHELGLRLAKLEEAAKATPAPEPIAPAAPAP
jgi:hypothetical protein